MVFENNLQNEFMLEEIKDEPTPTPIEDLKQMTK